MLAFNFCPYCKNKIYNSNNSFWSNCNNCPVSFRQWWYVNYNNNNYELTQIEIIYEQNTCLLFYPIINKFKYWSLSPFKLLFDIEYNCNQMPKNLKTLELFIKKYNNLLVFS